MISPNLAGLLVALAGGAFLYRRFKKSPPPTMGAPRAIPWRGVALTLLIAVLTATGVAAYNLSKPLPPVMILAPETPLPTDGPEKSTSANTRYLLTALRVREGDGKVVAAIEKAWAKSGDSLEISEPAARFAGKGIGAKVYVPSAQWPWDWVEFELPRGWSGSTSAHALGSGRAFIPDAESIARAARPDNLFSLITPGGDFHWLCFVTPMREGQTLRRMNAQDVVSGMQWLRDPIRAKDAKEYFRRRFALPESDQWRAAPVREREGLYGRTSGILSLWAAAFGWGTIIAFIAIPACFAASAKRRRALKFVGWVGAMLLLGVACERVFLAHTPEPEAAHRFFTESANKR